MTGVEITLKLKGGENMDKTIVDIVYGDADIYVDGQLVLHIGQVSDENIINLFLYPEGSLIESTNKESRCTHEILVPRIFQSKDVT